MKTIVYSLLVLIGFVTLHYLILANSERIASNYAIPYKEISDEEAYEQLLQERDPSKDTVQNQNQELSSQFPLMPETPHEPYDATSTTAPENTPFNLDSYAPNLVEDPFPQYATPFYRAGEKIPAKLAEIKRQIVNSRSQDKLFNLAVDNMSRNILQEDESTLRLKRELAAIEKQTQSYRHFSEHVSPIQEKIELAANISFSIAYIILALFAVRFFYRWLPANRGGVMLGGLKKIGYFSIGLLGKLGLKNYFLSYQLKLTEKEFLRVKNIFDNGLITEEEFLAKKRDITSKIRSNNLLNKEFPD